MPKRLDLTGKKFGRLLVLSEAGRDTRRKMKYRCKCDCGKYITVRQDCLTLRPKISCGCYKNELLAKRTKHELSGKRFGRLLVLEEIGRTKTQLVIWRCRCDCDNTIDVVGRSLTNGHTKSCGCLHMEIVNGYKLENHPQWKGGISYEPYCPKFNNDLKRRVREFFDNKCILCGKHEKKLKTKLCVHHVEYNKQACCDGLPVHFAALCRSCHAKTNKDRRRWEAMLHRVIDEIYNGRSYYTKEEYTELITCD